MRLGKTPQLKKNEDVNDDSRKSVRNSLSSKRRVFMKTSPLVFEFDSEEAI